MRTHQYTTPNSAPIRANEMVDGAFLVVHGSRVLGIISNDGGGFVPEPIELSPTQLTAIRALMRLIFDEYMG